jgi:hypothetical protein
MSLSRVRTFLLGSAVFWLLGLVCRTTLVIG